jgi:hypothetical protein
LASTDALAEALLGGQVVAEEGAVVAPVVLGLSGELAGRVGRDGALGPHLAVRVRVAGPHHLAAVLEQLDVAHVGARAELGRLLGPQVDHAATPAAPRVASVRSCRGEKQITRQVPGSARRERARASRTTGASGPGRPGCRA